MNEFCKDCKNWQNEVCIKKMQPRIKRTGIEICDQREIRPKYWQGMIHTDGKRY